MPTAGVGARLRGGAVRLSPTEARQRLSALDPDWELIDGRLRRVWRLPDFATVLVFGNRIGELAEWAGHHPDLGLGRGRVVAEWASHDVNRLTELDFSLAAEVGHLAPTA